MRRRLAAAASAAFLFAAASEAGQADPRLDTLFAGLAAAENRADAAPYEALIWILWQRTDNVAAAASVESGLDALSRRDGEAAIALLSGAIEAAPEFAEAWNKRATAYYLLGDYRRSIADIERVLALEPRHFGALSGLGLIFDALGDHENALAAYRAALAINPHLPAAQSRVAELNRSLQGRPL
ncbi:MAG: tetratricopeptide repeat protein [Pseudomonadota bacterium]